MTKIQKVGPCDMLHNNFKDWQMIYDLIAANTLQN